MAITESPTRVSRPLIHDYETGEDLLVDVWVTTCDDCKLDTETTIPPELWTEVAVMCSPCFREHLGHSVR